jgi:translocation and assembly module TamB
LKVVARAPLKVRNNLMELDLGIEGDGLAISGTNQRYGIVGEVRSRPQGRVKLFSNEFDVRQLSVKFDDRTRISPYVDATAVTDYRRASAIGAAAGPSAGRNSSNFRIAVRAYGPADNPSIEMTSEPALSQEDISLLLTVGLTKAEVDQIGSSALTAFAYEVVGAASGTDKAVKKVIPVDDFRFGSHYSPRTGRTEPNISFGQRITEGIRATLTSGIAEDRQIRTTVEGKINDNSGVQLSYDNINNVSGVGVGNFGADYRLRIEWQ